MASLPIVVDDVITYGSMDPRDMEAISIRDRVRQRSRNRTLSTSEVFETVERFGRRTISVSQQHASDMESFPAVAEDGDDDDDVDLLSDRNLAVEDGRGGRNSELAISNFETIIHILKGNIGIGVLTLPMAIRNSGLIFGSVGLVIIAYICVYCMTMLVKAAHKACANRENVVFMDYADTAEAAFKDAGGRWAKWASFMRKLLNTFLCLSQLLSNSVYVLFIAQNIKPIISNYGGEAMENLNYRFYILMVLGPMLLICSIRSLRYLSPCSVLANFVQFVGLGIVFYYIFRDQLPNSSSVDWLARPDRLPLFFGTAIFAIEGISVVLPIENQMRHPKDMLGLNGVLSTSMSLVVALYVGMGFYGYLKYGEDIASSITLNLPPSDIAAQCCLALFSLSIFFSYALQFYVLMEIIGPNVLMPRVPDAWYSFAEYSTRIVLNIITFALAATVPWLDLVVALLGAVKMSTLSVMAPAIIDTASHWTEPGTMKLRIFKNIMIFIFGLVGCIMGTFVALRDIIENFKQGENL